MNVVGKSYHVSGATRRGKALIEQGDGEGDKLAGVSQF